MHSRSTFETDFPELFINNKDSQIGPNEISTFESNSYTVDRVAPGKLIYRFGNRFYNPIHKVRKQKKPSNKEMASRYENGAVRSQSYNSKKHDGPNGMWWISKEQFDVIRRYAISNRKHIGLEFRNGLAIKENWSNMDVIWEARVIKPLKVFRGHAKAQNKRYDSKAILPGGLIQYCIPGIVSSFGIDQNIRIETTLDVLY